MIELPEIPAAFVGPVNDFKVWYAKANPGDWYTYHYGKDLHETMALGYVKRTVWDYAVTGKIYIFQTRYQDDPQNFLFQAQKASRIIPHLNPTREAEGKK